MCLAASGYSDEIRVGRCSTSLESTCKRATALRNRLSNRRQKKVQSWWSLRFNCFDEAQACSNARLCPLWNQRFRHCEMEININEPELTFHYQNNEQTATAQKGNRRLYKTIHNLNLNKLKVSEYHKHLMFYERGNINLLLKNILVFHLLWWISQRKIKSVCITTCISLDHTETPFRR